MKRQPLSTRKLKTFFQNYKLELTTGIHACIEHAFVYNKELNLPRQLTTTKTSYEEWTHIFSVSIVIIPTRLLCQMQANSFGAEFLSTISKFIKRKKILSSLVYVLHKTWNYASSRGSRAVTAKKYMQKSVMHVQSCCFALSSYCFFYFFVAASS